MADNKKREIINHKLVEQFYPEEEMVLHFSEDTFYGEGYIADNVPYTQTGSLPAKLKLKKFIPIMITCNHANKKMKENGIVNGARAHILDFEFNVKNGEKKLKIIWILFPEKEKGSLLREHMKRQGITHSNKDAVPILTIKKTFRVKGSGTKVTRKMFPLVVCFCMTSYKSQGQTLTAVIIDYQNSMVKHGQFYVAITRVRNKEGLFIRNFDPSQIYCREDVIREIKRLKNMPKQFYKTFLDEKVFNESDYEWKIAYFNINGMFHNIDNINNDKNLNNLHFLCLAETKLSNIISSEGINEIFTNFEIVFREDTFSAADHPHMGLLILQNKCTKSMKILNSKINELENGTKIQYVNTAVEDTFKVLFAYINKTPSVKEVEVIIEMFLKESPDFILGDLNLNPEKSDDKSKIDNILRKLDMTSELEESTRKNTTLDLVFKKPMEILNFLPFSYRNLYSDHATIGFRYCKKGEFCKEFKDMQILKQDKSLLRTFTIADEQQSTNATYDSIVVQNRSGIVRKSDLQRLLDNDWINDECINFYFDMLSKKSQRFYRFSTFFLLSLKNNGPEIMKRKFENADIFEYELWLIPVNIENCHWYLMSVLLKDIKENKVQVKVYDSLPTKNVHALKHEKDSLTAFIKAAYEVKIKTNIEDFDCHWEIVESRPTQSNDVDCGIFMLLYAKCLAFSQNMTFTQGNMKSYRKLIKREIENEEIRIVDASNEAFLVEGKKNTSSIPKTEAKFMKQRQKENKSHSIHLPDRPQTVKPPKFENNCGTKCWLNSLLQLFCLIFEDKTITEYHLMSKFMKFIHDYKENKDTNSAEPFRLFLTKFDQRLRRGQQDPMDFFNIYSSHKSSDYSPLLEPLKINIKQYIYCLRNREHYSVNNFPPIFFIEVDRPTRFDGLKQVIENFFHGGETVEEWICPVKGCGIGGIKKHQISNEKPEFLLVRVARWSYDNTSGLRSKNCDSIIVPETVEVSDILVQSRTVYDSVGVINHLGPSFESGHYITEIKMFTKWWRCNDDKLSSTSFYQLDDQGYIFLFKRR